MPVKLNTAEDIEWSIMTRRQLAAGWRLNPVIPLPRELRTARRVMASGASLNHAARACGVNRESLDIALWRDLMDKAAFSRP